MTGIITDIHRTSVVDGPGLRTTVFLKGCPLRCLWCHNPETQRHGIEPMLDTDSPAGTTPVPRFYGKKVTVEDVVREVVKDRAYYEATGGGVTVSGGEPLAQPEFAMGILKQCRDFGIHTTLDTCAFAPQETLKRTLACTDLYLFDYKATGDDLHLRLTGVRLQPILDNLALLIASGARVHLRCPMIPGVNDQPDHLEAIVKMERRFPSLEGIDILPWHKMGVAKYGRLDRTSDPSLPQANASNADKNRWRTFFSDAGCRKIRIC